MKSFPHVRTEDGLISKYLPRALFQVPCERLGSSFKHPFKHLTATALCSAGGSLKEHWGPGVLIVRISDSVPLAGGCWSQVGSHVPSVGSGPSEPHKAWVKP